MTVETFLQVNWNLKMREWFDLFLVRKFYYSEERRSLRANYRSLIKVSFSNMIANKEATKKKPITKVETSFSSNNLSFLNFVATAIFDTAWAKKFQSWNLLSHWIRNTLSKRIFQIAERFRETIPNEHWRHFVLS